jgi:hypothetical protein
MPWAAGTFGRLYGSAGWVDDRDAGTKILATRHDAHDQDLSDGINACLKKDGTNAATADLNAGGFKITNAADPTSAQDVATKAYVDGAGSIAFASGDQILWRSTDAVGGYPLPTGWTRAAQNNKALRIVAGSGALSSGGTVAFTSVFNAASGGTALTVAQMPGHVHDAFPSATGGMTGFAASGTGVTTGGIGAFFVASGQTGGVNGGKATGSNGDAHTHTIPDL